MIPIYQGLSDDFDRHDGSLSPYVNASNVALPYEKHYDLRAFHTTNITVPWTANDNTWWTGYRYPTFGVPQIGSQRSIVNVIPRNRKQSELDVLLQSALDPLTQDQVEHVGVNTGNEEWPVGDAAVTVGKDSAYRWSNSMRVSLTNLTTLTASGNEVTDATRAATLTTASSGQMKDGLTSDSSFGIRRAATNLFRRGQCDATTDWGSYVAATVAIDATVPPPFSTQSIKITTAGANVNEGVQASSANGQAAATGTLCAGSVWFKGTASSSYKVVGQWRTTDAAFNQGTVTTFNATGAWQLLTPVTVAVPATKTGDTLYIQVMTSTQRVESFWVAHAMLESGQSVVAPYVATSGGSTATHAAGNVQAPVSLLNTTQGWAAIRVRMGVPNAGATCPLFFLSDGSTSNRLGVVGSSGTWQSRRNTSTVSSPVAITFDTWAVGDFRTVIVAWDATSIKVSSGGNAFTSAATTAAPFVPTTLDIGEQSFVSQYLDGDVFWFACGTGTLTDANASTINGFGNADPTFNNFPGSPTALWKANTTALDTSIGTKVVNSYFNDDLSTDYSDGGTYNLELVLRSLPSQADASYLNLAGSSIDISSDVNFAVGQTDTLTFANSSTSLAGTSGTFDAVARWPLSSLVNANKASIKAIRFNLRSVGSSMTFIAQALRLVPNGLTPRVIGLDTKRATLARQLPQAGGAETASLFGDMFFSQTRPKNLTTSTVFNSGHLPATGSDDNTIRQYYRFNPTTGDRVEVRLSSRSTQTRLFIDHKIAGATTNLANTAINTNILTVETDYYIVTSLQGGTVTATVYVANGPLLGSQVMTLTTTTTITARGYVGMSFEPYFYDFAMRAFGTSTVDFGQFLSTNFPSRTPVLGATLYPRNSPSVNMLFGGSVGAFADAALTVSSDGTTYTATRAGTSTQGGLRYNKSVFIGESGQVAVEGKIFPVNQVRGTYRLGLIDDNDSVIWLYNFPSLLANQWNEFSILLPTGINPVEYYLHVQQLGSYNDTFSVRDLSLSHSTVGWEATANGGTNWQPFLNALDDRWSAVKFGVTGKSLAVRATTKSDKAYVNGYNLVPRYIA